VNLQDEIKKAKELLSQLEKKHAVELAKPKSKRVLVEVDCWGLNSLGDVNKYGGFNISLNDNAFIDEESAGLQAQRNTLVYKTRVAALECPVDWSDEGNKYYPTWIISGHYGVGIVYSIRRSQLPHFANRLKLEMFMDSLSTEEQKLLICGVE
tara:strand:+ start:481 stop:939 length:459 start_codon:yes stop_codon:yes gene_type:complete